MAIQRDDQEFIDRTARATRVLSVNAAGTPTGGGEQRTTTFQRVDSADTTAIPAGTVAYSVAVITAASAASPTLDGVALPANVAINYEAPPGDTLEGASVVTVEGDDVIITTVT
jgi:hypothetical protein